MTAPAGWWCPTCGHTQAVPVADQPDPEPCDECETTGQNCRAHRDRPVGVPVGDTPTPTGRVPWWMAVEQQLSVGGGVVRYARVWDGEITLLDDDQTPLCVVPSDGLVVPVGDDTPAPTEQFIITAGTNIYSPVGPFGGYGEAEDYYKANQPQGPKWLAQPTIMRLLRPAAVTALVCELGGDCDKPKYHGGSCVPVGDTPAPTARIDGAVAHIDNLVTTIMGDEPKPGLTARSLLDVRRRLVGDTPAPDYWQQAQDRAIDQFIDRIPRGDDTPAPTDDEYPDEAFNYPTTPTAPAHWTADGNLVRRSDGQMDLLVGPSHVPATLDERTAVAARVADTLNRAGAAPDLTALQQAVINAAIEWAADEGAGIDLPDGQHQSTEALCERLAAAVAALVREDTP